MTEAVLEWQAWARQREAKVGADHGWLALTGTHWLTSQTAIPGVPGLWGPEQGRVVLKASAADGLLIDGEPVDGTVLLRTDAEQPPTVVMSGSVKLLPIDREGDLAVRVYDPEAPARRAFQGMDRYDYDAAQVSAARYVPYPAERTEQVLNADGRHRGLGLSGELRFELGGEPRALAVTAEDDGELSLVFGDATNGDTTFAFRFLAVPEPDAEGRTVLDFNRAYLPPCAFSDHFVCPVPPAGNRLAERVEAGERRVRTA